MRTGRNTSYTKAVDLWALGAIVHEMLTSEIPFLDTYQDMDTMMATTDFFSATSTGVNSEVYTTVATIDTALVYGYCYGSEFPIQSLEKRRASDEAINFVKSLMAVNPRDRLSATDGLQNRWLYNPELLRTQFQHLAVVISIEDANLLLLARTGAVINNILHCPAMSEIWLMQSTAVEMGYLEVIPILLKVTDDINGSAGPDSMSLLYLAAGKGQIAAIRLLLKHGADIDAVINKNGQTALCTAAAVGHLDAIKLLLEDGAMIDGLATNKNGQTALHAAAAGGHLDAIRLLLDSGATIDRWATTPNGQTPLHAAAAVGHLDPMKLLLDWGAHVHGMSTAKNGQTVLHGAAAGGHRDAIRLLLDSGATVDQATMSITQDPVISALLKAHRVATSSSV